MSESSNDVDPNPFVLDVTINPDIKCPIENVVKKKKENCLFTHTQQVWRRAFVWPLNDTT